MQYGVHPNPAWSTSDASARSSCRSAWSHRQNARVLGVTELGSAWLTAQLVPSKGLHEEVANGEQAVPSSMDTRMLGLHLICQGKG